MDEDLLNIDNFNIIQDNDNYYFLRALNMADNNDIEQGITIDSYRKIQRVRTDRERYEEQVLADRKKYKEQSALREKYEGQISAPVAQEKTNEKISNENQNGKSKYSENSQISLEEVFDHIKAHYRKDTNCISLASNANVSLYYGRGFYKDKYIMITVPKKDFGKQTVLAGQYMLQKLKSRINQVLENIPAENKKEILEKFSIIESANNSQKLRSIIKKKFTVNINEFNIDKIHPKKRISYKMPIARISDYKSLKAEQLLEVNKQYAKLAILENKEILCHVIPHVSNSKLRDTIGRSFSSAELIHYGEISKDEIIEISKEAVQQFALIQQAYDIDKDISDKLKQVILEAVQNKKQIPDVFEILYKKDKKYMELKRCKWCNLKNEKYVKYHDEEWGKLNFNEHYLYEMLILESFQAGLSWECVLNKRENFRKAYDNFDIEKVVNYDEDKMNELIANEGIIRNKLKIKASIKNSQIFKEIEEEFGSFGSYLKTYTKGKIIYETGKVTSNLSDKISNDLQKRGMKFVGSTIIYSYLQAIGVINSHEKDCFCSSIII